MGNIGLETSNTIPDFKKIIHEFFDSWIQAFTVIYKSIYENDQAQEIATARVQELEGAIMLCRFFDDITCIEKTVKNILTELKTINQSRNDK